MAKVKIYTTPTCPWCKKTKAWLKQHRIPSTELNVARNEKARNEMMKKSGQGGVPVLDINGKIIVGYDVEGIQDALAQGKKGTVKKEAKKKGFFSFLR